MEEDVSMSTSIPLEFQNFCYAIMLGAACECFYAGLRVIMNVCVRSFIFTCLIDLLYWCVTAVGLFLLMYYENGGMIRNYGIFGMVIGMLLFELSLGKIMVNYGSKGLGWFLKLLHKILGLFGKVLKKLLKLIGKPFTIIRYHVRKRNPFKTRKNITDGGKRRSHREKEKKPAIKAAVK